MTLYAARRDPRALDTVHAESRSALDLGRSVAGGDAERRREPAPFRRTASNERRTTRLLPTGLW